MQYMIYLQVHALRREANLEVVCVLRGWSGVVRELLAAHIDISRINLGIIRSLYTYVYV